MIRAWLVSGAVQGVGFRNFVQHHAHSLALGGWVRNLPDGRVEVVAAGEDHAILELQTLLNRGPRHSRVSRVEYREISDEVIVPKLFDIR